jgi:hypothetical protein
MLFTGAPAHALNLTANPMNPLSSGTYSVTINQLTTTQYSVVVTGNNDGRLTNDASGPQKHSVGRVSIGFLRADNTYIQLSEAASSGGTSSGAGFVGAPWVITTEADVLRFNAPAELNDVAQFGGNSFSGIVTLAAAEAPARVTAALQNGTQQWYTEGSGSDIGGQGDITPEPGSLALALPGLLPLALMLRRRRRTT